MSGVSGVRAFSTSAFTWEALNEMAAAQRHRGPDGSDVWVGPDIGLAQSRPSTPSLEQASGPARSVDGRWVVALDGMVLNHDSLRSVLDYPFRTHDDAEVVVAGLALEGISFVERLAGRFAFVAHDLRTGTTHLVRDRVGVQPLHYRHVPGGIAFASEVKALLVLGPPPQVDHRSLDAYLACRAVPAPDTLFEGIKKVRPAHRVSIMPSGHVEDVAYWMPPEADPDGTWSDGDAVESVRDGLREAVRSALVDGATVGVHLTGGLSSSLLAAHAQQLRGDAPLHSFAFASEDTPPAEVEWTRRISRLLGTEHHEVRPVLSDLQDLWSHLSWHRDAPLSEPTDLAVHALAHAAGEHVPSLISGDGADELFGGHQRYRLARLAERSSVLPGRLGSSLSRTLERHQGATFSAPERQRLLGEAPPRDRRLAPALGTDPVDRMLRHDLRHALPDDVLERLDRMSMAASLDVRLPFLDHHLVELAFRLPTSVKVRSGCTTWVLREAARPLLPDEVIERRVSDSPVATVSWYAVLRDTARQRLTGTDSWVAQTFDQGLVRDLLLRHEHGGHEESRLWALLSLELWHDCFFGSGPHMPQPRGGAQPGLVQATRPA